MFDFTNQVIWINGAVGNLGQAVVRAFDAASASLVLVDHKAGRLQASLSALTGKSRHLAVENVDSNDPAPLEQTVQQVLARYGRIDVLVNTVGGYAGGTPVYELTPDQWDAMFTLNARSAFLVSRAVLPAMLSRQSGKIIHVSSRAGLSGPSGAAPYGAAKSAVIRLTESLAAELKPKGINVNCILPGTIDTPQNRAAMPKADTSKWVQPEAIADVILFLASDAARALNGVALPL
jgi:NAD(P)-dependent dehydrogenase (short-subunit alcohol dehydrogenase family)